MGNPLTSDVDVVYQMPFVHEGVRGIVDFLIRVTDEESGAQRWGARRRQPRAQRGEAGPRPTTALLRRRGRGAHGHRTDQPPRLTGSGKFESIRSSDVPPYWNRLRSQLARLLDGEPSDTPNVPEPCDHCQYCEFAELRDSEWRPADSLVFVALPPDREPQCPTPTRLLSRRPNDRP